MPRHLDLNQAQKVQEAFQRYRTANPNALPEGTAAGQAAERFRTWITAPAQVADNTLNDARTILDTPDLQGDVRTHILRLANIAAPATAVSTSTMPLVPREQGQVRAAYQAWLNSSAGREQYNRTPNEDATMRAGRLTPQFLTWLNNASASGTTHNAARALVGSRGSDVQTFLNGPEGIARSATPAASGLGGLLEGMGLGNLLSGGVVGLLVGMLSGNMIFGAIAAVAGALFLPKLVQTATGGFDINAQINNLTSGNGRTTASASTPTRDVAVNTPAPSSEMASLGQMERPYTPTAPLNPGSPEIRF